MKNFFKISSLKFLPTNKSVEDEAIAISQNRITFCMIAISFIFSILIFRVFELSLSTKEDIKISRLKGSEEFYLERGTIVDRNDNILAVNITTASVYANPKKIVDAKATSEKICHYLSIDDCSSISKKLRDDKTFIWIKRHLTPSEQQELQDQGIPGIYFIKDEKRVYPHGNLFSHVLGYVDIDGNGLAGIEKYFDKQLASNTNQNLKLSLDIRVQEILRDELINQIKSHNAIGGSGVVMDIQTGEVISMVSLPDYDPHQIENATERQKFNQVTLGVYEMGSTFKALTMAMGLDGKKVSIKDSFSADAVVKVGNKKISDFRGKGGMLSVPEILMYSSNIGTAQVAMRVGVKKQREYLSEFGLMKGLELEIPEKSSPLFPPQKLWSQASLVTISYGHGMAVTPMHLAKAFSAVINDGKLARPTLIYGKNKDEEPDVVLSKQASDTMKKLLHFVVLHGSGRKANIEGYVVGGKTGTAEKVIGNSYSKKLNISSFVGGFPMTKPKYVVLVLVDEATGNAENAGFTTGGMIAAPIAGKVIQRIAPILGVKPVSPDSDEMQNLLNINFPTHRKSLKN